MPPAPARVKAPAPAARATPARATLAAPAAKPAFVKPVVKPAGQAVPAKPVPAKAAADEWEEF
jgi:hypothetical protein